MRRYLSRRDFIKLAGLGLGAMAFTPITAHDIDFRWTIFSQPKRLPQFPGSSIIGRVTEPDVDIRNRPTNDPNLNTSVGKLGADSLVEWSREVLGNVVGGLSTQRYVETPQGYVYAPVVQLTRNQPNTPVTELPNALLSPLFQAVKIYSKTNSIHLWFPSFPNKCGTHRSCA